MFSFLFSGGSKEDEQRLNDIQASVEECSSDGENSTLDLLAKCAHDLCEVMDAEVSRGAKNERLLRRIEVVSSLILDKLVSCITSDLVRKPSSKAALKRMRQISLDLDAVRATKASTFIENKVGEVQEQFAKEELQQVAKAMEQLKEVKLAELVQVLKQVLSTVESSHARAPTSQPLTEALLKKCAALANFLLVNLPKAMLLAQVLPDARALAERLDAAGSKLAKAVGATWEPPTQPKLEALVQSHTSSAFNQCLAALEAAIAGDGEPDLAAVSQALSGLQRWWPLAKEVDGIGETVQQACESVDARVEELFRGAVESGESERSDAILQWAGEYDEACAGFTGIAAADSSLRTKLMSTGFAGLAKHLDALDAELAKGQLRPATTVMAIQVLQQLAPTWSTAVEADGSLAERLNHSLTALEEQVEATAGGSAATALGLIRFAKRYDELRAELAPAEATLESKLVPIAADACLSTLEEEAAKDEMNLRSVLSALEPFRTGPLQGAADEARLAACVEPLEEQTRRSYCSAREEGSAPRLEGLRNFAATFDTACTDLGLDRVRSLCQWLELLELLAVADAELARKRELEPAALADTLAALRPLCAESIEVESVAGKFASLLEALRPALLTKAAVADDDDLERCCQEADGLCGSEEVSGALGCVREVVQRLNELDEELAKETGMNPNAVLEALEALKASWESVGAVYELGQRLQRIFAVMEQRMAESCEKAIAAGATRKVQALLSFARRCDEVRDAASGDARLRERLVGLVVGHRIDTAKTELEKESGMNPVTVLTSLKTLAALWSDLDDQSEYTERVGELGSLLASRMQSSMDEAAKAGNRRKAEALVKFAKEYDEALDALGTHAGLCEELAKGLLKVASGTGLDIGEDFMAEELRSLESFMSTESVKEAFRKWDKSGGGTILQEEFSALIQSLDPRFTDEVVAVLFAQADLNCDGQIDYEEFIGWLFAEQTAE